MHNQHAGLSQALATQHITERQEQAAAHGCCAATAHRAASPSPTPRQLIEGSLFKLAWRTRRRQASPPST
jgi:hypothetical protein